MKSYFYLVRFKTHHCVFKNKLTNSEFRQHWFPRRVTVRAIEGENWLYAQCPLFSLVAVSCYMLWPLSDCKQMINASW